MKLNIYVRWQLEVFDLMANTLRGLDRGPWMFTTVGHWRLVFLFVSSLSRFVFRRCIHTLPTIVCYL